MRFPTTTAFLLFFSVLFVACVFEEGRENFVHVEQIPDLDNVPDIVYSYNQGVYYPMEDTLWLSGSESLSIQLKEGSVYGYSVEINDSFVIAGDGPGPFSIKAGNRPPGTYKLAVIVFAKSGTGSLADKVDAEYVSYTHESVLIIGEVSFKPKITSIVQEDGTVKLNWNHYPHGDFQAYRIRKEGAFSYSNRILIVSDQSQTTLEDSTYVGGRIYYKLEVDKGGKYISSDRKQTEFPYRTNLNLIRINNNKVKLSWSKAPYYRNIRSVRVGRENSTTTTQISPEQFSIEFDDSNSLFGQMKTYTLTLTAKVDNPGDFENDIVHVSEKVTLGKRTPPFNDLEYSITENAYYVVHAKQYYNEYPDAIYKLDQHLNIIDSVKHTASYSSSPHLVQSPDGNHLYLLHDLYITPIDKRAMSLSPRFNTGKYFNQYLSKDNFSVSNNNFIVYHGSGDVTILNYDTKQVLLKISSIEPSHISPDGQYFINGSKVYHFDGSVYTLHTTLPYSNVMYVRFPDNSSKVLITTATQVILYDFAAGSEVSSYSFSTPSNSNPHFDHFSKKYAVRIGGQVKTLDITNGLTLATSVYENIPYYQAYFLAGDYLFISEGFGLKPY